MSEVPLYVRRRQHAVVLIEIDPSQILALEQARSTLSGVRAVA